MVIKKRTGERFFEELLHNMCFVLKLLYHHSWY